MKTEEVKIGQVYRDNDPRGMKHDIIVILKNDTEKGPRFLCQRGPRKVWILEKRLRRRGNRGYSLIEK